jgi:anti-anti-sigma factor
MNPVVGKLSVWVGKKTACVRIAGRANFALSVPFRKLLQHLREAGNARVLLDLSECQLMDSTFLGVLAFEAKERSGEAGGLVLHGLELLNANPTVRQLIEDIGVAHLFQFAERDLATEQFAPAPDSGTASREELNRTCLEAHELLMALHPANVEKFRDVARFFADELKKST